MEDDQHAGLAHLLCQPHIILRLHVLQEGLLFACDELQNQPLLLLQPFQVVVHLLGRRVAQPKATCIVSVLCKKLSLTAAFPLPFV